MAIDPATLVGTTATYSVAGSGAGLKVISSIMLMLAGVETTEHGDACWIQMNLTKTNGDLMRVALLLEDPRLSSENTDDARVLRYIYQECPDLRPIEYTNAVRGGAVTTVFGLLQNFMPRFEEDQFKDTLFPENGRYAGLKIRRTTAGRLSPEDRLEPGEARVLALNPEMLIGTGRNTRDTHGGRIWSDEDYPYRRLNESDYHELIEAGFNLFRVDDEQLEWVRHKPVFYQPVRSTPRHIEYPERFYRANDYGDTMFMDEPAVHIVWFVQHWPGYFHTYTDPTQFARLLETRVRETHDSEYFYGRNRLESFLRRAPYDLGDMTLPEDHYPSWETMEWSAWYQLKAGMPGIVHEGRYVSGEIPQIFNAEFDTRIPTDPESIFLLTYAHFRGAARMFNGDWGTAIYGQAEEEIVPLAMEMAYDMGARYLWFWTSDRLHHVPYEEQVALTRHITTYAKKHPRPPLPELNRAARTAIALPDGYTFRAYWLWDCGSFHIDRINQEGVTYRRVLAAAAGQVERCIREKTPFDLVYDDQALRARLDEYDEVIIVNKDATVTGIRRGNERFEVPPPERPDDDIPAPELTIRAEPMAGEAPLTVTFSAEVTSRSGRAGTRWRPPGRSDFDYLEMSWIFYPQDGPARLERTLPDIPVQYTFEKPGNYKVTGFTFDDRGVATRKSLEINVR